VRILSLGQGLPEPNIDNYTWASSLSFFDYDAIVVDPAEAVSKFVESVTRGEGDYRTYDDIPIAEGPTTSETFGLVDLLRERREEVERLLARGGLVVCFAYPDVPHPRVGGFTGCHRYYWLPAPAGCDYGPAYLRPASGRQAKVADWEHPFAAYIDSHRNDVLYRAALPEGAAGFPGARVIARSPGGAVIAAEVPVGGGRVVFLPALSPNLLSSTRSEVASHLVAAIRNTLLQAAEGTPPEWTEDYPLPGLQEAQRRIAEAEAKLDELEAELDEARTEYRGIERYQRILWQEGKYGFELPVRDALTLLGATSYASPDEPAVFSMAGEVVFVEAESSTGAVGMDPHYRLRERVEQKIADDKRRPFGLVIVNGYREQAPASRQTQFTESLRIAAESMRYCLLEATTLFRAVKDKLEGKGDAAAFLKRIVATEGLFSPPEASQEEERLDSTARSAIKD